MARLVSIGGELNSSAAGVELTAFSSANVTIDSSVFRSGAYAIKSNPSTAVSHARYNHRAANTQESLFVRFYFRVAVLPAVTLGIFKFLRSGISNLPGIRITSGGALQLYNFEDGAQIGSDSTALALDTWYRVEMSMDTTTLATTALSARIDGVQFASGTANLIGAADSFILGQDTDSRTYTFYYDDVAINSATGSFQNSWPGEGSVVHLRPNAAGDNNQWRKADGSAGDANNYQLVDEVTPDDTTTKVRTALTVGHIDDYNLEDTPGAIGASDTINVVQVGVRFAVNGSGGGDDFKLRIKAASGGTVEESAAISPTSSTWTTNAVTAPKNYALTLYDLPGASSTPWTKADLDAAQVGLNTNQTTDTNASLVSALWLLVESVPTTLDATANAGVQTLTFSIPTPTVSAQRHASPAPAAQELTFSVPAVGVSVGDGATPATESLTFTIPAPAVATTRNPTVAVPALSLSFSIPAVGVSVGDGVVALPETLTFSIPTPAVTTTRNPTVAAAVQELSFSVPGPSVTTSGDATAMPATLALSFSIPAPTVAAQRNVAAFPTPSELTLTVPAVGISVGDQAMPAPETLTFSIPVPTVGAIRNVAVAPLAQQATFSVPTPGIAVGDQVTPAPESLTFSLPGVSVSAQRSITIPVPAAVLTFSIPAPTVGVGIGLYAPGSSLYARGGPLSSGGAVLYNRR